eukprot:4237039-Prymnesium_polylepis.1
MPTQARGSIAVFEYCERGLTAKARHPKGIMFMTFGRWPVSISYDVTDGSGPDVRLSTSTAISTARGHQVELRPLPVKYDR